MSLPPLVTECSKCFEGWITQDVQGKHYYLLQDGKVHGLNHSKFFGKVAWCNKCHRLMSQEPVPDEKELYDNFVMAYDELDRSIQFKELLLHKKISVFLANSSRNMLQRNFFKFLRQKREYYEAAQNVLKDARCAIEDRRRRDPDKCSECGGIEITPIDRNLDGTVHPHCGGTFNYHQAI